MTTGELFNFMRNQPRLAVLVGASIVVSMVVSATPAMATPTTTMDPPGVAEATMVQAPTAPTSTKSVAGMASATVSWTAPASNGGASITEYRITAQPGGIATFVPGTQRSATVTGLVDGTQYTFTVAALNSAGESPESARNWGWDTATPGIAPIPAYAPSAYAVDEDTIEVVWGGLPINGAVYEGDGPPLIDHTVRVRSDDGQTWEQTFSASTFRATLDQIPTSASPYTITIVKRNVAGSTETHQFTAEASEPRNVQATPQGGSVKVTWTPPVSQGGAPITHYVVTSVYDNVSIETTSTSQMFTGLTPGKNYRFTVAATNAAGPSIAPYSNVVQPLQPLTTGTPEIDGVFAVDASGGASSQLTAMPGQWAAGTTLSYRWFIDGAVAEETSPTLAITRANADSRISVEVTGTLASNTQTTTSPPTLRILLHSRPTLVGDPRVGSELTVAAGEWTSGAAFTYQWFRNGSPISGATAANYVLQPADSGASIYTEATGTSSGYGTATRVSNSLSVMPITPPAPSISFTDISGHVFQSEITWMANNGISRGWQVGPSTYEFRPQNQILRGEMAAFLYRLAGQPAYTPPVSSPFIDVPTTHVFYKEISWLASTGISKGWVTPNGTEFRAEWSTTREVMAAFLHRFEGSPAYAPSGASPFRDVQPGIVFYNEILWLAAQGISTGWDMGYGCRDYRPAQNVLRSEMAAFIYRMENGGTAPLTGNTCSPPRN